MSLPSEVSGSQGRHLLQWVDKTGCVWILFTLEHTCQRTVSHWGGKGIDRRREGEKLTS